MFPFCQQGVAGRKAVQLNGNLLVKLKKKRFFLFMAQNIVKELNSFIPLHLASFTRPETLINTPHPSFTH